MMPSYKYSKKTCKVKGVPMSEDGMDDWAAAMAEQAESEAEQDGDNGDVQVAELDELTDDAPITQEEKRSWILF